MDQIMTTELPRTQRHTNSARLVVTGHFVRTGRVGGAEPMLYNLLQGLSAQRVDTTFLCGSKENLSEVFLAKLAGSDTVRLIECGGRGSRFIAEQRACLQRELSGDAILFPNYYVPPVVPRRLGRVGVVMHDFQYRHFPQYFSAKKRAWLRLSQAAAMRRADRVIVISEFVRQDAIRWFGNGIAEKLVVIPNALCTDRFADGSARGRPCAQPYILSVAAQYPHKNLETLVRAFAIVARSHPDIRLVLCGQPYNALHGVVGKRSGLGPLIEELGLTDRVQSTGYIDDPTLGQWYRHAEMFAFPSLFEGFGMPPVEALSFGLPTLTAAATALPEATLGMAELVQDAVDVAAWSERIAEILNSPQRFRPGPADVARLRAFYDPARIGGEFAAALV